MGYSGDFSNSYLEPSGACPKELDASGAYMFWRSMLFSINALGLNLKELPMDLDLHLYLSRVNRERYEDIPPWQKPCSAQSRTIQAHHHLNVIY